MSFNVREQQWYARCSCFMLWFEGGIKSGKLGRFMSAPEKENACEMPVHILDQYLAARSVSRKGRLNGVVNRLNNINATNIVVISSWGYVRIDPRKRLGGAVNNCRTIAAACYDVPCRKLNGPRHAGKKVAKNCKFAGLVRPELSREIS